MLAEADKQEFERKLKRWLADPVVVALGKAFVTRKAAQQKRHDDKVRLITIEKNMLRCQLQKKIDENERMSTTMYKSDETIAALTDENQKLKITLAAVQKSLRGLATRCSKATQKDIPDLQMQGMCLLTQKAYSAPKDKGEPRARSRSPRRSEDVD